MKSKLFSVAMFFFVVLPCFSNPKNSSEKDVSKVSCQTPIESAVSRNEAFSDMVVSVLDASQALAKALKKRDYIKSPRYRATMPKNSAIPRHFNHFC